MRRLASTLLALGLTGCVATQRDILDLSQSTDGMTLQIHNLKKVMASLQANQADLNERLGQMSSDMSHLTENLSDNKDSMSKLSSKLDDLGTVLGHKFSNLDTSIKKNRDLLKEREREEKLEKERIRQEAALRSAEEDRKKKEEEEKAKADEQRKSAGPTPSQIYHKARIQLSKKQYPLAEEGFQLYINDFPKGEVVDLATYYLGKVRYAQEKWEPAAQSFALVLDRYPKSDVTPAARLHYALALMKLKIHLEEAERYLESIPEDFPRAPEAQKAKEILKNWEKKKASKKG